MTTHQHEFKRYLTEESLVRECACGQRQERLRTWPDRKTPRIALESDNE